jgi:thiol-disulfide isomerase/thioredoxin
MQAVLFFWASWSAPCKHMQQVLETLAKQHPSIAYLQVCHSRRARHLWVQDAAAAAALPLVCCCSTSLNTCVCLSAQVEAEEVDDVTEQYSVTTVPYFVLLQVGLAATGTAEA